MRLHSHHSRVSTFDPAFTDTELAGNVSPIRESQTDGRSLRFDFTDPEHLNRARDAHSAAARQSDRSHTEGMLRISEATRDAYRNGRDDGYRTGHASGWKHGTTWGIFCGAFVTGLSVVIAVCAFASYTGRPVPVL